MIKLLSFILHSTHCRPGNTSRAKTTGLPLVAALSLLLGQVASAQVVHKDGEFDISNDWTFSHLISPPEAANPSASVEQLPNDGNPGLYAAMTQKLGALDSGTTVNSVSWAVLINNTAVYDPGDPNLGTLTSVKVGWDVRRGLTAPRQNVRIIAAFVAQDGFVWGAFDPRRIYDPADVANWLTGDSGVLVQNDFRKLTGNPPEQPANPDFSSSGSPLTFGVGSGNSCPPTSDCRNPIEHPTDFDNFWVEAGDAPIPGRFVIRAPVSSFAEDAGEFDMQVTREFGKFGDASITIVTAAETASEHDDYGAVNTLIMFADGEFGTKPVSARILDDQDVEGDETFRVELTNPTGGTTLGTPSFVQITIVDDDSMPRADVNLRDSAANNYALVTPTTATLGAVTAEFPLRFEVQARVHNNGPDDVTDIKVEIRLPKIALAAFDVVDIFPDSGGTPDLRFDNNCTFAPRNDPDENKDFVFIRCTYAGPLSEGETLRVPTDPIMVGYAETVRTDNMTPPIYFADIRPSDPQVVHDPDHGNNMIDGAPSWSSVNSGGGANASKGGGAMSLPWLLFVGLVVRRQRKRGLAVSYVGAGR